MRFENGGRAVSRQTNPAAMWTTSVVRHTGLPAIGMEFRVPARVKERKAVTRNQQAGSPRLLLCHRFVK